MKFAAWLKQDGDGCDYTIGCGYRLIEFDAPTTDDAIIQIKEKITGYRDGKALDDSGYTEYNERKLESAVLFEIAQSVDLPLIDWYDELNKMLTRGSIAYIEEQDRKEYERLKQKFG